MIRLTLSLALVAVGGIFATACDGNVADGSCTITNNADGSSVMTCPDGTQADLSAATAAQFDPAGCTVTPVDGGAMIACGADEPVFIANGSAGADGANGADGIDGEQGMQGEQGLQGVAGADGLQGADGENGEPCTIEVADGQTKLVCPDGSEWVLSGDADPVDEPVDPVEPEVELTLMGSLTPDEMAQIDVLRDAIEAGLTLGNDSYMDTVSLSLQQQGVVNNYEGNFQEDYSLTNEEVDACPFVKNLANTVATQFACDYLVEIAKTEVSGDIVALLDAQPVPEDVAAADESGQAGFWYEQGAISGIEQRTILVRSDLQTSLICNVDESGAHNPTPDESAYEKGLVIGAQAMADAFNDWLAQQGHTADYPAMSQPIQVCNINGGALDPARQNAKNNVDTTHQENPLCSDYEPPNPQTALMYADANQQYSAGIEAGIEAEYALAAVRIFKVIPCNVGDPLVVDMDGDGIELRPIHEGVNFDFYGVGKKQATAWVSSDDALLVMDRNHDGAITSGLELFGNVDQAFMDGFTHLAQLDQNGDGIIDAQDPGFAELKLWRDNGDAISQPSELLELSDVGMTFIPLNAGDVSMRSGGNRIPKAVQAGAFLMGDAYFTTAPYASPRF
ncbi:MAG: hypothetical protein ACPGU1_11575 [Myxococcota bacterium]